MKKKNWEIAKKLVVFCDTTEPKLDYMHTLNQLAEGLAEFDGENLKWTAKKLTKPEQKAFEMNEAASSAIDEIMEKQDISKLKMDTVIRLVCLRHPEIHIDSPKLFKRIIREVVQKVTAPAGIVVQDGGVITMKESEINPVLREWIESKGIKIIPLPEQVI